MRPLIGVSLVLVGAFSRIPTSAADDGDAIAIANGRSVSRTDFVDVLVQAYGLEVLQQLIMLELAKGHAGELGLHVNRAEIDAEFQNARDKIAKEAGMSSEEATDANKQKALEQVLQSKHISMAEFMVSMERNAYLRKAVEGSLKVDPKTVREEFARTYGEKVRVRHIQVPISETRVLQDVVTRISRGDDFAELARRFSSNADSASRGGEMEPFTFKANLDPALREAAFSLAPGETSPPIRTGRFFHILKLEERIPPENVRFEDVREQVERNMRERAVGVGMEKLAIRLFKQSKVRVLDPELQRRYQEFLRKSSAAHRAP